MKKMHLLLSALALVIATLTPIVSSASSAEVKQGQIEVSQTHSADYGIVIPAGTTTLTNNSEFVLSARAFLEYNKELTVSVTSTNNWKLKDKVYSANEETIPYKMKYGSTTISEQSEDVLKVSFAEHNGSVTLTAFDIEAPEYAGTYSDTLTFTTRTGEVTVKDSQPADSQQTTTEADSGNA